MVSGCVMTKNVSYFCPGFLTLSFKNFWNFLTGMIGMSFLNERGTPFTTLEFLLIGRFTVGPYFQGSHWAHQNDQVIKKIGTFSLNLTYTSKEKTGTED